jgi:hypothetical protein
VKKQRAAKTLRPFQLQQGVSLVNPNGGFVAGATRLHACRQPRWKFRPLTRLLPIKFLRKGRQFRLDLGEKTAAFDRAFGIIWHGLLLSLSRPRDICRSRADGVIVLMAKRPGVAAFGQSQIGHVDFRNRRRLRGRLRSRTSVPASRVARQQSFRAQVSVDGRPKGTPDLVEPVRAHGDDLG